MPNALTGLPWKRLWRIGKPFWVSNKRNPGVFLLLGVLALLSANAGVMVFINKTAGQFMTAIEPGFLPLPDCLRGSTGGGNSVAGILRIFAH
jgi:ABC-type uncharacterized transport system fused permease/ATPase subunit